MRAQNFVNNKDCIIFLIDCQPPMFAKNEQGEVPFYNAIRCAVATLTDKIISSDTDLVGVCLYGTVRIDITAKQNLMLVEGEKESK